MTARPLTTLALLSLAITPLWAQSAVDRANDKDQRAIEYRNAHCAPGNEAACARANAKDQRGIAYRDAHATAAQRDPDAALRRANDKDERSIAYRNAHCGTSNSAACARANAKTERAMTKRDDAIRH